MNNDTIVWSPGVTLEDIEEQVIKRAFSHFQRNKTATASALGIAIRTLDAKLEKYTDDQKKRDEMYEVEQKKKAEILARSRGVLTSVKPETVAVTEEQGQEPFAHDPEFQTMKLKSKSKGR